MPNAIKYNVSAETLALKKGNFWIGTGDVGKGPTSSTGYYNGITPPSGGYTIYLNKASGGPSIYTVTTEAQMVSLTNSIGSQSFTTSGQCLNWFATQTDKMIFNRDYPAIVTNGLVMNLDAGFTPSYPTTATTWYDVGGTNNGTLTNGPTYSSDNGGIISFDGTNDIIQMSNNSITNNFSYCIWVKNNGGGSNNPRAIVMSNGSNYIDINFQNDILFSLIFERPGGLYSQNLIRSSNGVVASLGVWAHYACTYNREQAKIYFNGVEVASSNYTEAPYNLGNTFTIGAYDSGGYNLNGFISNAQLYNRALSATEILQNYNATKGRFGL